MFDDIIRLCLLASGCRLDGFNGRRGGNLRFRFGDGAFCRAFLFRRLFLLGGFRLADFLRHSPEVEQGELHARLIIRFAGLYLRLFLYRLRFFGSGFFRPCRNCRFRLHGRLFRLGFNGNRFSLHRLPDCARIQAHGKPHVAVLVKHTAQVLRDACCLALVRIDHSGLAVRVGVEFCGRMHDTFGMADKIGVVRQVCLRVRLYHGHQPFVLRQFRLAQVLLQYDKVAAHLCPRIVRKQVVGQADCRYQIRLTEQLVAHGGFGAVQYPLRGDERHDAAVAHCVQPFQEKIVVDGFLGRTPAERFAPLKPGVEHGYVTERDVGHRQVEIVVERLFDFLKTVYAHLFVGVELPQDRAREEVFLKRHHVRIGTVPQHGVHEHADTRRRLKHTGRTDTVIRQHIGYGVGYLFRGVEGCQHGRFQRVHIPLVLRIVLAVPAYQPVQFRSRGKQFEVGFRPVDGVRQFPCRVQDTFQPAETAILLKYRTFFGGRRSPFPVKGECRPYRLDVVPQPLFAVKRHTRRYKGRRLPSAPCRAGRNRATGRSCRPKGHRRRIRFRQAEAVSG